MTLHTRVDYDAKGRRVRKPRIYVQDEWIQCNGCLAIILWDDAHADRLNFGSGKRANCKDCQRAKRQKRAVEARYAREKLAEDQALYGGVAFTYLLMFVEGNVLHVYVGMTTQSPRLRFAQHMGGTHVPELSAQLSALAEVQALSVSAEQRDILQLSGISQSLCPDLPNIGWGDSVHVRNRPVMHVVAHPSIEAAAVAERATYDRLSAERRLQGRRCKLLNRQRPSGGVTCQ